MLQYNAVEPYGPVQSPTGFHGSSRNTYITVDSKPVDRTSAPGDGGERNEGTRPNDWSNWAAFWQGVHIWTPCENVQ